MAKCLIPPPTLYIIKPPLRLTPEAAHHGVSVTSTPPACHCVRAAGMAALIPRMLRVIHARNDNLGELSQAKFCLISLLACPTPVKLNRLLLLIFCWAIVLVLYGLEKNTTKKQLSSATQWAMGLDHPSWVCADQSAPVADSINVMLLCSKKHSICSMTRKPKWKASEWLHDSNAFQWLCKSTCCMVLVVLIVCNLHCRPCHTIVLLHMCWWIHSSSRTNFHDARSLISRFMVRVGGTTRWTSWNDTAMFDGISCFRCEETSSITPIGEVSTTRCLSAKGLASLTSQWQGTMGTQLEGVVSTVARVNDSAKQCRVK